MSLFRFSARKTFALVVVFCLSTAVLVIGCDSDSSPTSGNSVKQESFIPVGEWASGYDSYTINKTRVDYLMDNSAWGFPNMVLKGNIEKPVTFTANAGVLIIKVIESSGEYSVNKYTCVYYSDCTENSIKLANPIGPAPDYDPIEAESLSAAVALFTVDNVGDHVSAWGIYTK